MSLDTARWQAALDQLGKRGKLAIARGLNRTGATERTAMARAVAKDMGIKVGSARDAITVKKATRDNLAVRVVATGRRLPLIDFKARGPVPSRGRGRGVTYVVQGQRKRIADAFITTVRRAGDNGQHQGHLGVFVRATGARRRGPAPNRSQLPIKQLYGVSIAVSFQHQLPAGEARRNEVLLKNVEHEIQFELSRLSGGGRA